MNECDHITRFVGEGEYGTFDIVRHNKLDDFFRTYECYFCPECGAKITEE